VMYFLNSPVGLYGSVFSSVMPLLSPSVVCISLCCIS